MQIGFGKLLVILGAIAVTAAVVVSIWLNPPSAIRARAIDQKRWQNLQQTENAIKIYYDLHHALPAELKALDGEDTRLVQADWHDPETQSPFEYAIESQSSYRLCAVFARRAEKSDNPYDFSFKKHGAGRDCFQYTVNAPAKQ